MTEQASAGLNYLRINSQTPILEIAERLDGKEGYYSAPITAVANGDILPVDKPHIEKIKKEIRAVLSTGERKNTNGILEGIRVVLVENFPEGNNSLEIADGFHRFIALKEMEEAGEFDDSPSIERNETGQLLMPMRIRSGALYDLWEERIDALDGEHSRKYMTRLLVFLRQGYADLGLDVLPPQEIILKANDLVSTYRAKGSKALDDVVRLREEIDDLPVQKPYCKYTDQYKIAMKIFASAIYKLNIEKNDIMLLLAVDRGISDEIINNLVVKGTAKRKHREIPKALFIHLVSKTKELRKAENQGLQLAIVEAYWKESSLAVIRKVIDSVETLLGSGEREIDVQSVLDLFLNEEEKGVPTPATISANPQNGMRLATRFMNENKRLRAVLAKIEDSIIRNGLPDIINDVLGEEAPGTLALITEGITLFRVLPRMLEIIFPDDVAIQKEVVLAFSKAILAGETPATVADMYEFVAQYKKDE